MTNKNNVYTVADLDQAIDDVMSGKLKLRIPVNGYPESLNAINIAAYTLLKEATFKLTPCEIQFLGRMTAVKSMSRRQANYLERLFNKHLGVSRKRYNKEINNE